MVFICFVFLFLAGILLHSDSEDVYDKSCFNNNMCIINLMEWNGMEIV